MKFLANMGISQSTTAFLKEQGFDAVHLRDQNLQRLPDPEIIQKGHAEGRIILTCDLESSQSALEQGAIITVEERRHRIRLLPINP